MSTPRMPFLAWLGRSAFARFYLFRKEAVTLWHAFWHPDTPFYLKAATLFVAAYLLTPLDVVRDLMPPLGLIDDFVLVPLMVSLLVHMLPAHVTAKPVRATVRRRY